MTNTSMNRPDLTIMTGIPSIHVEADESTPGYTLSYRTLRSEQNERQEAALWRSTEKTIDKTVGDFLYGTPWRALVTWVQLIRRKKLVIRYCPPVRMEAEGKVQVSWRLALEWWPPKFPSKRGQGDERKDSFRSTQ